MPPKAEVRPEGRSRRDVVVAVSHGGLLSVHAVMVGMIPANSNGSGMESAAVPEAADRCGWSGGYGRCLPSEVS